MIEASQSATFTNTPGHSRARLEQILNPTIDGRVAANVAGWEKKRFQLDEAITSKELGEEVTTAMFTKLALKMSLHLDAARLSTCHALKDEIERFALAIVQNRDVAAMELDAMYHSGKGKHGPGKSNGHRQFWEEQGAAQRQQ